MEDPASSAWEGPDTALTMVAAWNEGEDSQDPLRQHFSLRTLRWRYIRYNTGAEELYDHDDDPHEWKNLAGLRGYEAVTDRLRKKLAKMTSNAVDGR